MSRQMMHPVSWDEFRENGLLWMVNMILHIFGYAICVDIDADGKGTKAFPARCEFRGFSEDINTMGYEKVTKYLRNNISDLVRETEDQDHE